jgi:DNA (cytosine-5)-methyltransferase 1
MLEVLELFGGIGACTKALERLNIPYHIADYVEIDKYAVASFNAMHGTDFKPQDICTWDKDIKVDFEAAYISQVCQYADFSVLGL